MIITEQKPLDEIIESLAGKKKIFLVGCGDCATSCRTGGQEQMKEMKNILDGKGKTVTGICVPDATCVAAKLKTSLAAHLSELRQSEVALIFSCGLGVGSFKDNDRLSLTVLPGCNSLAGALLDSQGNLWEKCAMCGNCILGKQLAYAPLPSAPKGF